MKISIFIPTSNSLKEKRMILKSLKSKMRSIFNISLSEIDEYDKWQKSILALAMVGDRKASIDSQFSHIVNFLENSFSIQLSDYETEFI